MESRKRTLAYGCNVDEACSSKLTFVGEKLGITCCDVHVVLLACGRALSCRASRQVQHMGLPYPLSWYVDETQRSDRHMTKSPCRRTHKSRAE